MNWIKVIILLTCVAFGMGLQCTPFTDVLDKTFECKGNLKNYSCDFQFHHKNVEVYFDGDVCFQDNAKHGLSCENEKNNHSTFQSIKSNMSIYDVEDLITSRVEEIPFRIFDKKANITYCRIVPHYQTLFLPAFKVKELAKTDRILEFQLDYDESGRYFNLEDSIPYNVTYFCKDNLCEPKSLFTKELRFRIENLPYAYFEYEIHVNISIENCSNWTEQVLRMSTASRIPEHVPVFKDYYFSVNEGQVMVYWEELKQRFHSGTNFHYKFVVWRDEEVLRAVYEGGTQTTVDINPYGNYIFSLQSCNEKGCSANKTSIYYNKQKDNYKLNVWTTFNNDNYKVQWYAVNEKESPINFIVAFYEQNSMKHINFIEGINATSNLFEMSSSKDPTFGIVANYRNYTTGIVWNLCKSEAKSCYTAPEIILITKSSAELKILFQNFYCALKASADLYEITYCDENSCLEKNVTNKDLLNDEFILSGLKPYTNYNVSLRIFNKYLGFGKKSNVVSSRTAEGISSAPQNLEITNRTATTLTLNWKPPKFIHGEVQSYLIRLQNSGPSIVIPANSTSYTVKSLNCSTTYDIRLTLKTKFFESLPSNLIQGTTKVAAPLKPELNDIIYEGNTVILKWKKSECLAPSNSFYVLSIGERQSIIPSERCTLTQPICDKNVSTTIKLFSVNRVLKNESNENCRILGDFDQLCEEHDFALLEGPQTYLCSEELVTELRCSSFKYLMILYIGLPVCFIILSIICLVIARKIMNMRDIKCIPPKGLVEVNENCNEEMYNLM